MRNLIEINDELDVLKAQMQILTNQLANNEIVSEKMLRATIDAKVKSLLPNKHINYISLAFVGIFLPVCNIYGYLYTNFCSLPFLICSLVFFAFCIALNIQRSRLPLEEVLRNGNLVELGQTITKWRKMNANHRLITCLVGGAWIIYYFIENWSEVSARMETLVFVCLLMIVVFGSTLHYFHRVSKLTQELKEQIDELTKD